MHADSTFIFRYQFIDEVTETTEGPQYSMSIPKTYKLLANQSFQPTAAVLVTEAEHLRPASPQTAAETLRR